MAWKKLFNKYDEFEQLREENLYLKKVANDAMTELTKYHSMTENFIERTDSILDMVEKKTGRDE